jgi:hypothetical protein
VSDLPVEDPMYQQGAAIGTALRAMEDYFGAFARGLSAGYARPEPEPTELPPDDRIDNAQTAWDALPWYRRLWEWVRP